MERKTGFEPATPTLARLCSTPELLPPLISVFIWWRDPESNWGHADFQSAALPTELSRPFFKEVAGLTRLELATSGVTGRRSNRLSYNPASTLIAKLRLLLLVGETGFEPVTPCL